MLLLLSKSYHLQLLGHISKAAGKDMLRIGILKLQYIKYPLMLHFTYYQYTTLSLTIMGVLNLQCYQLCLLASGHSLCKLSFLSCPKANGLAKMHKVPIAVALHQVPICHFCKNSVCYSNKHRKIGFMLVSSSFFNLVFYV